MAQSVSKKAEQSSICSLQERMGKGTHETVRVSGVISGGLELGTLQDSACPKEVTWVELALRSDRNRDKLAKLLERTGRVRVLVEGEFYGPPTPDPKVPEKIRESYRPGWGHLAAFKTKIVVYEILKVKTASEIQ